MALALCAKTCRRAGVVRPVNGMGDRHRTIPQCQQPGGSRTEMGCSHQSWPGKESCAPRLIASIRHCQGHSSDKCSQPRDSLPGL